MSLLFRKSVIEKQGQQRLGNIVLSSPFTTLFLTSFLILFGFILVLFIMFGEYSRKERVLGFLTPKSGLVRIMPKGGGLVDEVNIKVGQHVNLGEKLFSIKVDTLNSQGLNTAEAQLKQLELEKLELEKIMIANSRHTKKSKARLARQIQFSVDESTRLAQRIELQGRRVDNEQALLEKLKELEQESASSSLDVAKQENQHFDALQTLYALKEEFQRYRDRTLDLEEQYELLDITSLREESEIRRRLLTVEQRRLNELNQGKIYIPAPISGEVVSLTANIGQSTSPLRALATIVPENDELIAQLFIPSRAAGQIANGQTIRLLYDAFPYQKFGFQTGRVVHVSRSVINTTDLEIAPSILEPVFLIEVQLDTQSIKTKNGFYHLQPGMTLSADIVLEDRKIWEWILEPILKVFNA